MKDRVVFDVADEAVKGLWLNTKFAAKAFRVMNSPVIQKMKLRRFWYRWSRVENTSHCNFILYFMIVSLPICIVFHLEIQYRGQAISI